MASQPKSGSVMVLNEARGNIYRQLLSSERIRETSDTGRKNDPYLETISDTGRIVRSSPFRRLQGKAQVFSMARSAAVRTRLTHSIEVSNYGALIAESLARNLIKKGSLPEDLRFAFVKTVENACLLHDIGNPPFGHMGEYAIQTWFGKNKSPLKRRWTNFGKLKGDTFKRHLDAYSEFDGNPHGFRIITRLQWFHDKNGMNLSVSLLASYLKYLGERSDTNRKFHKKIGYFPTEEGLVKRVWKELGLKTKNGLPIQRHPLVFLMEAADDIAYCLSDIEDALEQGVVSEAEFLSWIESKGVDLSDIKRQVQEYEQKAESGEKDEILTKNGNYHLFRIEHSNDLVKRAVLAYENNEGRILSGDMDRSLLSTDSHAMNFLDLLKKFCTDHVYTSREAVETELTGLNAITGLLDAYIPMMGLTTKAFDDLRRPENKDRLRDYPIDALLFSLLPNKHLAAYEWSRKQDVRLEPFYRVQLVVDYIAGMTDSHVLKIFNMINGTQQFGIE
jgi:dGTPase